MVATAASWWQQLHHGGDGCKQNLPMYMILLLRLHMLTALPSSLYAQLHLLSFIALTSLTLLIITWACLPACSL
jgi:hypothetical protein